MGGKGITLSALTGYFRSLGRTDTQRPLPLRRCGADVGLLSPPPRAPSPRDRTRALRDRCSPGAGGPTPHQLNGFLLATVIMGPVIVKTCSRPYRACSQSSTKPVGTTQARTVLGQNPRSAPPRRADFGGTGSASPSWLRLTRVRVRPWQARQISTYQRQHALGLHRRFTWEVNTGMLSSDGMKNAITYNTGASPAPRFLSRARAWGRARSGEES
jgi:hypothetical protein